MTGHILDKDHDCDDFDWQHHNGNQGGHHHHGNIRNGGTLKSVQISAARAQSIALGRVPGATVKKCKLDYDDGCTVYELELWLDVQEYELEIDTNTGTIIKYEADH